MMTEKGQECGDETQLAFEKARMDYCISAFNKQQNITDVLERRAKFFLSFITIIIGSIFLKLGFLETFLSDVSEKGIPIIFLVFLYASLSLFGLFLLSALTTLLLSMRLRKYNDPYPIDIVNSLFAPDSDYLKKKNEEGVLRKRALNYAIAIETNAGINKKKAKWMELSFLFINSAVFSLFIFLISISAYYISIKGHT